MTGFQHDIAGGNGDLVATSVQSPNFQAGAAGWQIARDGSAEFNDVTVRGTVIGSVFESVNASGDVITEISADGVYATYNAYGAVIYTLIPDVGWLLYADTGSAAQGALAASGARAQGTDQFGNTYRAGLASYGPDGCFAQLQYDPVNGYPYLVLAPPGGTGTASPQVIGDAFNAGAADEYSGLFLRAGQTATGLDEGAVSLYSESKDSGAAQPAACWIGTLDSPSLLYVTAQVIGAQVPVVATEPGTSTPEGWHAISLPSTGTWGGTLRVKLLPLGKFACLDVNLTFTTTTSSAGYTAGSVPSSSYYPAANRQYVISCSQQWAQENNATPRLTVNASGAVTFQMPAFATAGASCIVSATVIYPLD